MNQASESPEASSSPNQPPLLELQKLDVKIEQLQHRLETLPERVRLNEALEERAEKDRLIEETSARRVEAALSQERYEGEAGVLEEAAKAKDNQLYSSTGYAIRDLQALQTEIQALRAHQASCEEQAIQAMVEADELSAALTDLETERNTLDERVTVLQSELDAVAADITAEMTAAETERGDIAAQIDSSTLGTYEHLRQQFGDRTAVSFDPSRGCDCSIQMPSGEISRIKRCSPGDVLECDECGRMVLR